MICKMSWQGIPFSLANGKLDIIGIIDNKHEIPYETIVL